jgi:hypothetical protein
MWNRNSVFWLRRAFEIVQINLPKAKIAPSLPPAGGMRNLQRKRAVLTDEQASEIVRLKSTISPSEMNRSSFTSASIRVSTMYGVSPKTVRVSKESCSAAKKS